MMKYKTFVFILISAAILSSCFGSDGPSADSEIVTVAASPNLKVWLNQMADDFNSDNIKTTDGKPIFVVLNYHEAGQIVLNINSKTDLPDIWIPDIDAWTSLVEGYSENCQSVAASPLLIAMWKPIAESLGWPGRSLGWLDIGSLAADPSAWQYYSGGQYGLDLNIGHTHPGLSAAGVNTMLAVVHAAQSKQDSVSVDDIEEPIVQASVRAFESAVSAFSPSTEELAISMVERGPSYLGAAVLYENQIYQISLNEPDIVPIYPLEGTFQADFPACPRVDSGTKIEAISLFIDRLLSADGQSKAFESGLRPVNSEVTDLDGFAGTQYFPFDRPEIVYNNPQPETVLAIQSLWESSKKPVNLVMIIDTSRSMAGEKLENAKVAAVDFIQAMHPDDHISIIIFDEQPKPKLIFENVNVGNYRESIIQSLTKLVPENKTPLYDSLGVASESITKTTSARRNNVILLLSDGQDTISTIYRFDQALIVLLSNHRTNVYTIGYGSDADINFLETIAYETNGQFFEGDVSNIAAIYQEMSILFGGSVGIGR